MLQFPCLVVGWRLAVGGWRSNRRWPVGHRQSAIRAKVVSGAWHRPSPRSAPGLPRFLSEPHRNRTRLAQARAAGSMTFKRNVERARRPGARPGEGARQQHQSNFSPLATGYWQRPYGKYPRGARRLWPPLDTTCSERHWSATSASEWKTIWYCCRNSCAMRAYTPASSRSF